MVSDSTLKWRVISIFKQIKIWLLAVRAPFFSASLIPVLVGSALARHQGFFRWPLFIAALGIVVSNHAGSNLLNDYCDAVGSDPINHNFTPFSGGSRLIQKGIITRRSYLIGAWIAFATSLTITLAVALFRRNPLIAFLGVIGLMLGVSYSANRINAMSKGWGEIAVGLAFGPISVIGSYLLQTGRMTWESFLSGVPVGFLVMGILILNEFPDWEADGAVGKRNWIVRAGCNNRGVWIYLVTVSLAYFTVLAGVWSRIFPVQILFSYATLPLAVWIGINVWRFKNKVPEIIPALAGNIFLHLLTGLLICVGLFWG